MTTKQQKTTETHVTLEGRELTYPTPRGALAAFLDRVVAMSCDPRVTEDELVELIYGTDNPLLDQTMFEGRGAVTREVFADPVYHVLIDFLGRKRAQLGTLDMDAAREAATVTVTEAARQLGISTSAVRQAIHAGRLPAVTTGSQWLINPRDVELYKPSARGPAAEPALRVRFGNVDGKSLRPKIPGLRVSRAEKGSVHDGEAMSFQRAAVAVSDGKGGNVLYIIEPADAAGAIRRPPFYVRGRFRVVETVSNPAEASFRFTHFAPVRTADDREHRRRELARLVAELELGEQIATAVEGWDGEGLAVVPTQGNHGKRTGRYHLDLRHWAGGDIDKRAAKALMFACERVGIDFVKHDLTHEFEDQLVTESFERRREQ